MEIGVIETRGISQLMECTSLLGAPWNLCAGVVDLVASQDWNDVYMRWVLLHVGEFDRKLWQPRCWKMLKAIKLALGPGESLRSNLLNIMYLVYQEMTCKDMRY